MNKAITKSELERIRKCIVEMNNKWNFSKATGIAPQTIDRILERGYAREEQVKWMLEYCDKVEGKNAA